MRKLVLFLLIFSLTVPVYAGHKDSHNPGGSGPERGPRGEQGPQGEEGPQGEKGERGLRGKGLDDRVEIMVEARMLDTKNTTWSVYGGHDVNNSSSVVGAKLTIKFGKSYEEKRIDELEKKIEQLTK